jgi:hypothetical protein
MRPDPKLIKDILDEDTYTALRSYLDSRDKATLEWSDGFGRYLLGKDGFLDDIAKQLLPVAREAFNSPTLVPSYSLCAMYKTPKARLTSHKDDNACTYTLDMCVSQVTPWELWVEGKPYTLQENEALAYYGNDQEHWREEFTNPLNNKVTMIFFHYVEPEHWYITKGPSYLSVIRKEITEEVWSKFQ